MSVGSTQTRGAPRGRFAGSGGAGARAARLARTFGPAVAILVAQQVLFPAPAGIVVRGLVVGGLTALVALGMALVYRTDRIINFAQADLGLAPTVLAFLLMDRSGWPYPAALAAGFAAALVLAATTERVVIRRFSHSPRLLVTVATIGLSQVLVAIALLLPRLWDLTLATGRIAPPFDATATFGTVTFDANDLLALIVTPAVLAAVSAFLRRSDAGTAIRAAADSADRAALLGVPVARLRTVVWMLAGSLAFAAVFLRSGILDLPTGTALGFGVLLRALVALVLGRLTDLPAVTTAAVALGVLELGIAWDHDPSLIDPVLGLVVIVALIWRRRQVGHADRADVVAWRAADEIRPVPRRLAALPSARALRWTGIGSIGVVAVLLGRVLTADQQFKAAAVLIYALLGLSLVLLSGWGGVVSLGQIAFFAIGAAVTGFVVSEWHADLVAGLVLGMLVAAAVAAAVGVPALRLRGLYLAVVTFAFALATTSFLLDDDWFGWVPSERIGRVPVLGGLEAASEGAVYYLALVVLVAVMLGLRGIRHGRFGRALVAVRDNEAAAASYAVDPVRLRLAAFSLSAAIAALAGGLFVHHQRAFDPVSYAPVENLAVVTMVVVGGMTSLAGAVLGALALLGSRWFLDSEWQFLATGVGVLLVLLLAPQGLAGVAYHVRDRVLRTMAVRHGMRIAGFGAPAADDLTAGAEEPTVDIVPRALVDAPGAAHSAGPVLLRVRGVDAGYGGTPVLHGVDLEVATGEAVALLGTNGAGKSTLLGAVSGLVPVAHGRVEIDGRDITGMAPHEVAALGVVQMPGGQGIFPSLTVAENLRVAGWLRRHHPSPRGVARREPAGEMEDVDAGELFPVLHERAGDPAGSLSGGQQQMLALAMAVVGRPRLLMIDELSLGLAPAVVADLLRFVDDLRAGGTALVIVEQSVNIALEVCDRAIFLERGRIRYWGPAADLADRRDLLRSVFLGAASGGGGAVAPATEGAAAPDVVPVLRAVDLSVSFGGVRAVDDVSLAVGGGEIVGVIGPNGAGKTTLLDVLGGSRSAGGGRVELAGRDVTHLAAAGRARRGLGRSFQDARLFPSLTVDETIGVALERWVEVGDPLSAAFHLPNVVDSEAAVARRVDELVELLGLGDHRSLFVRELSTGTRRVVDLACLLAFRPRVVLLDEPASGIAQREVEQLAPLVRRIRDETGASLAIVEHDLPFVREVADRVVAMDQGRVLAAGSPEAVLAHPDVVRAYIGVDDRAAHRSGLPGRRAARPQPEPSATPDPSDRSTSTVER